MCDNNSPWTVVVHCEPPPPHPPPQFLYATTLC